MVFSSISFLYYFLPVVFLLYFALPKRSGNGVLLLASLVFYGYGEPRYLLLMGISILTAWALGLIVPRSRAAFFLSVGISLGFLVWFKYADFFVESFATATGIPVEPLKIGLPIGISFYTFQILSYTIDLYRGKIKPQANPLRFATYVALFPQLIAGPIVVYASVEQQLDPCRRQRSVAAVYEGARRFIIGLAKKALLANGLGEFTALLGTMGAEEGSVLFYWIRIISFAMQIYFDFSGYSDMAIGLGRMLGFSFPENFNYPYIAGSITEFWRRWHMTLGGWFREYVYIPLGGNRVSATRWVLNLFVVWGLTGLWHGAAWNFVVWGLFHGFLLMMEKLWLLRLLEKAPSWLSHLYVLFSILIGLTFFQADSLGDALENLGVMFGFGGLGADAGAGAARVPITSPMTWYYLKSYGVLFLVGIIGCLPWAKRLYDRIAVWTSDHESIVMGKVMELVELFALVGLLLLVTAYLVDGSYNPFLYFRF
ncbi:MAG: MBOAT family protein [Firmicutes bacterium]|nr:MBOAT family protein [Bacillota bacterium]